jgi:acetyl-CoA synthetase
MTESASATATFRAARDLLLRYREDYDGARREFSWPELGEFNWALDWFDVIAAEHPDRTGLRIVAEDGDTALTYAELAARSAQVANWLRDLGVRRGDRVLLMLGNVAPLWEIVLAVMKLGAVLIPSSTLLQPADLADRIPRGDVRHVITEAALTGKFADVPGDWTRVAVGPGEPAGSGWHAYSDSRRPRSRPRASRGPGIRCCSTSHRAPPRSRSWSRTLRPATPWGTCPPCTGSASSRATCT